MSETPEKLMIRVGKSFEASASGRFAIIALLMLVGVVLTGFTLHWW